MGTQTATATATNATGARAARPTRARVRPTSAVSSSSPDVVPVSPGRINDILNNLEIKFINCKIIFSSLPIPANYGVGPILQPQTSGSQTHGQPAPATVTRTRKKKKNFFAQMLDSGLETLKDAVSPDGDRNSYTNCIFSPGTEHDVRKQVELFSSRHRRYTFVNCRFIQRESRFLENIGLKFRRMLGIVFNLDYLQGCVEIADYKLKLKYIPEWTQRVIEQVEED